MTAPQDKASAIKIAGKISLWIARWGTPWGLWATYLRNIRTSWKSMGVNEIPSLEPHQVQEKMIQGISSAFTSLVGLIIGITIFYFSSKTETGFDLRWDSIGYGGYAGIILSIFTIIQLCRTIYYIIKLSAPYKQLDREKSKSIEATANAATLEGNMKATLATHYIFVCAALLVIFRVILPNDFHIVFLAKQQTHALLSSAITLVGLSYIVLKAVIAKYQYKLIQSRVANYLTIGSAKLNEQVIPVVIQTIVVIVAIHIIEIFYQSYPKGEYSQSYRAILRVVTFFPAILLIMGLVKTYKNFIQAVDIERTPIILSYFGRGLALPQHDKDEDIKLRKANPLISEIWIGIFIVFITIPITNESTLTIVSKAATILSISLLFVIRDIRYREGDNLE